MRYEQGFNWGLLRAERGGRYEPASYAGSCDAFHAYSEAMRRGYEFLPMEGCDLDCETRRSAWRLDVQSDLGPMAPGEVRTFRYAIGLDRKVPVEPHSVDPGKENLMALSFEARRPTEYRGLAPSALGHRSIRDMVRNIEKPKVRGLNLRTSFPGALKDIATLAEWGCGGAIS